MIVEILQHKIAEMALRIESARLLTHKAAALKDEGRPFSKVSLPGSLGRVKVVVVAAVNCFSFEISNNGCGKAAVNLYPLKLL